MTKRFRKEPDPSEAEWRNLRDSRGRLYGRVNATKMLLEIRRNQTTITFDLTEILQIKPPLEKKNDIE